MKKVINANTRLNKNAKPIKTVLTLDFEGCTMHDLIEPATDSLVITWQGRCRRAAAVPAVQTIKVKDFLVSLARRDGGPETVESLAAKASTMSDAERKALIERLTGKQQKAA